MPKLFNTQLLDAFSDLEKDLTHKSGPQISTIGNYRFAILQYDPELEYTARQYLQRTTTKLVSEGWSVLSIDLHQLLLKRIKEQGDGFIADTIEEEKMLGNDSLSHLADILDPLLEGPTGLSADVAKQITDFVKENPDKADRTVAFVGRAGSVFPFYRSSALLRHIDGNTAGVPVILLYPGTRQGETGLSFMGIFAPDNDYRPRIYP